MSDIRVRNLDDGIVAQLKERARLHGRSLEGELREVLTQVALGPRREMAERTAALRAAMAKEFGLLPDSAPGIRREREGEGE
jgi:plasmid stability protein